jgi:hypothetical protein
MPNSLDVDEEIYIREGNENRLLSQLIVFLLFIFAVIGVNYNCKKNEGLDKLLGH